MDATKPYEFMGFGTMDATKPNAFIGPDSESVRSRPRHGDTKTAVFVSSCPAEDDTKTAVFVSSSAGHGDRKPRLTDPHTCVLLTGAGLGPKIFYPHPYPYPFPYRDPYPCP